MPAYYCMGVSLTGTPLDRDLLDRNPLDRDPPVHRPLWTETLIETPLDKDPLGQRSALGQSTPWTDIPLGQRHL